MSARLAELVQNALNEISKALDHIGEKSDRSGYTFIVADDIRKIANEIGCIEWQEVGESDGS